LRAPDLHGVPTHLRREPGLVHNFLMLDYVSPACAAAVQRLTSDVRRVVGGA
jgi:hypothetical protein